MSEAILYPPSATDFTTLGIGPLLDAKYVLASRGRNETPELTFTYPVNGPLFSEIKTGCVVVCDVGPNLRSKSQRFEITAITKPKDGKVQIFAEHIVGIARKTILQPGARFTGITAQLALNQWMNLLAPRRPFTVFSDVGTQASIDFSEIGHFEQALEALGGKQGSILQNFGGEYVFDNWNIRLMANAGRESGVVIAYGKNLTNLTQEKSIETTYTSVYPYAKVTIDEEERVLTLPELYVHSKHVDQYPSVLAQMVDFSDREPQTIDELRTLAKQFVTNNQVGVPKVNLKVAFADLAKSVDDTQLKRLEEVELCDTVTVAFNQLDIQATAKVIKTVWDVRKEEYRTIELGDARSNLSTPIRDQQKDRDQIQQEIDWVRQAQREATDIINNPGKGHVVIYPSIKDPQELLILDTTDINTARNVWRWNIGGLGFSRTGFNGTYELAMTNNGAIVADRITTGTLRAIQIIGVAITGSSFETTGSNSRVLLQAGMLSSFMNNLRFMDLDGSRLRFFHTNGQTALGQFHRTQDTQTRRQGITLSAEPGTMLGLSVGDGQGNYNRRLMVAPGSDAVHVSNLEMGTALNSTSYGTIRRAHLSRAIVPNSDSFQVNNNVGLNFYSPLNMNGFSILNVSDIRLKEHIRQTEVKGIEETKKLNFVDFEYKRDYLKNEDHLLPEGEQFGLVAQYTPFLAKQASGDHYLKIDMNKQVNLNTKTNQELISIIEAQELRLRRLEEKLGMEDVT